LIGAADAYAAGGSTNINNALAFMDWDLRRGTNNGRSQFLTQALNSTYYTATEALAASFDRDRPSGVPALTVDCYEGGAQPTSITLLTTAYALGLSASSGITVNVGSSPAINWTGHGLDNGACFACSVNITETNLQTITAYNITAGHGNNGGTVLYVINKTTNGFDLSHTVGGPPIMIKSVGPGPQTGYGSNYAGGGDRIARLLAAYKQSSLFRETVTNQYAQMFAKPHTATVTWFTMNATVASNQWTMYYGDVYSTPRYISYDAVAAYHS
jgi:hypothetical protein